MIFTRLKFDYFFCEIVSQRPQGKWFCSEQPLAWLIAILVVAPAIFIGIEGIEMAKSFQIILG